MNDDDLVGLIGVCERHCHIVGRKSVHNPVSPNRDEASRTRPGEQAAERTGREADHVLRIVGQVNPESGFQVRAHNPEFAGIREYAERRANEAAWQ